MSSSAPNLQPPPLVTKLSDTTTTTTTTTRTARTGEGSVDSITPDFQNNWVPGTPPSISISTASATGSVSASIFSSRSSDNNSTKDDPNCPSSPFFNPRVVYGAGTIARLPSELGRFHLHTPLIVSSPSCIGVARRIQTLIPNLDSRILDSALVSVPQRVVDDAVSRITDRDCVISIGGSSAMGLAKTIAGIKEIPHVCIPTTYSGSEMSQFTSESSRRRSAAARRRAAAKNGLSNGPRHRSTSSSDSGSSKKSADVHSKNLPSIIIYDEDLTATIATRFSAPSCANEVTESRARRSSAEDAQWSYIHLPGV